MSDLPPITQRVQIDTSNYKAGVTELNRQIRVVESGFRAAAAGMGDWDKSAAGLEERIRTLNSAMDLQKQKVDGLQGVYDNLAKAGSTSKKELDELQIRINKETETLGKMRGELDKSTTALNDVGKETRETGDQMDHLADQTERTEDASKRLASVMRGMGGALKIGAQAIAGIGLAAAGAVTAISGLVLKSADMAGELVDTANQTGIGVEKLQELAYIGDQVGVSIETITGSLAKLTRNMDAARGGTGAQADAFKALGVNVTNADGSLRSSQAVFQDTLAALGGVGNETERDALAMAIFGKSAMELNPLIKTSAAEIAAMTEEAHKLGAIMSEEDVMALEGFGDTLASLKAGLQGTLGTLATAFLPTFQEIAGQAKTYLGEFSSIVKGSNGDLGKMAEGIGGLLGRIANDIAAQAPAILQAGLGILQGIINAIVSNLPTLLPAGIAVISSLVQFLVDNLPILINAGVQILLALVSGILPQLPKLVDAALQMIVTLANGIAEALPVLIPMIATIIPQIITILVQNLPLLIDAALKILLALVDGLIVAIPILIEAIPQIVEALVTALIESAPLLIVAAIELINSLVYGLIQNIPVLISAVFNINSAIIRAFENVDWGRLGMDMINGIKAGFDAQWSNFVTTITENLKKLVTSIKTLMKIKSPSKVFADIGGNMALGLGQGFDGAMRQVQADVNQLIGGMAGMNLTGGLNLTPAGAGAGADPVNVNIQASVANNIDMKRLARDVVEEIRRSR